MLAVNDAAKSAEHYINVLGFKRDLAVDGWQFLSLGDFHLGFKVEIEAVAITKQA